MSAFIVYFSRDGGVAHKAALMAARFGSKTLQAYGSLLADEAGIMGCL